MKRGEMLLNFCLDNGLEIVNTVFYQRKAKRKWTWESPDGKTKNIIDFIIINNRWKNTVTKCRTFTGPDTASDHRLVMAGIRIKMKKTQTEMRNKRFWIEGLKEDAIKDRFKTQLGNR